MNNIDVVEEAMVKGQQDLWYCFRQAIEKNQSYQQLLRESMVHLLLSKLPLLLSKVFNQKMTFTIFNLQR